MFVMVELRRLWYTVQDLARKKQELVQRERERREEARRKVQQHDIAAGHARQCVCDGVQLLQA